MRLFALLLLTLLGSACAVREAPITSENDSVVALARRGEQLFKENCNVCHPGGGKGLGPALERSIARESQLFQIRNGFGLMPAFSEEALSKDDVDAVLAYVDSLVVRAQIAQAARAAETTSEVVEILDALAGDLREPVDTPNGQMR